MNTSINTLNLPKTHSAVATARHGVARFGQAVWRALENHGRSRARREMLMLANHYGPREPELAARLRAAAHDLQSQ